LGAVTVRGLLPKVALAGGLAAGAGVTLGACSSSGTATAGTVVAVGAENQYADVIAQIGGRYVHASAVESNPDTDPHAYEASPKVAQLVSSASLVVQNGLGYDAFMNHLEAATPDPGRKVIVVQHLLGLPDDTPNPHLWYDPTTMPKVAKAVAGDLSELEPSHAAAFAANLARFDASLQPWYRAIAAAKASYAGTPVATTEPVADYLLEAMGLENLTPFVFQADVMNGVDPSPQDVAVVDRLFTGHMVKAFVYNEQVTDSLTRSLASLSRRQHVPVVGVYETMPVPGFDYQTWMEKEVQSIVRALADHVPTGQP
jgi:zinc/manganese transport system substrate-binding protein